MTTMSRAPRVSLLAAGVMLATALTACGGSSSGGGHDMGSSPDTVATATSGTPVVTIQNFQFSPATLVINKGMTVRFVQQDSVPHNVVGSGPSEFIKSPQLNKKGDSYTVTFSKTGSFDYICTIHPRMVGKVIVQ
jgi:plastocyanin